MNYKKGHLITHRAIPSIRVHLIIKTGYYIYVCWILEEIWTFSHDDENIELYTDIFCLLTNPHSSLIERFTTWIRL